MFKALYKGILSAVAVNLLTHYRHLSIQLLKIEAAKSYLQGVRMARLSALGLAAMGLVVGLICTGVLLVHAALFILLPWSVRAKAALGLLLGVTYLAAGVLALRAALSEKAWIAKSGAAAMLADATGQTATF